MIKLRIFVIFSLSLAILFNIVHRLTKDDIQKELASLKFVMPDAEVFSKKEGNPPHYKAYKDRLIGICYATTDIVPEERGYSGPIKMMVGIDLSGKITGIEVLSHTETPSYVYALSEPWFKEQFKGKDIRDKLRIGDDLDGITRATITSEAVSRAVKKSAAKIATSILNIKIPQEEVIVPSLPLKDLLLLSGLFIIGVVGLFIRKKVVRYIVLLLAILYIGIIKNSLVSVINFANLFLLKFPVFTFNLFWYYFMCLAIISLFIFGLFYCGWLCPFGAMTEFLYRILYRKTARDKDRINIRVKTKGIKYIILWIAILIALVMNNVAVAANLEPFVILFGRTGNFMLWSFVFITLLFCLFEERFWCRYFCPAGAGMGLLSALSLFKIRSNKDCIQCGSCVKACPMLAIDDDVHTSIKIDYKECILCNECILVCPKGSLAFKIK